MAVKIDKFTYISRWISFCLTSLCSLYISLQPPVKANSYALLRFCSKINIFWLQDTFESLRHYLYGAVSTAWRYIININLQKIKLQFEIFEMLWSQKDECVIFLLYKLLCVLTLMKILCTNKCRLVFLKLGQSEWSSLILRSLTV